MICITELSNLCDESSVEMITAHHSTLPTLFNTHLNLPIMKFCVLTSVTEISASLHPIHFLWRISLCAISLNTFGSIDLISHRIIRSHMAKLSYLLLLTHNQSIWTK